MFNSDRPTIDILPNIWYTRVLIATSGQFDFMANYTKKIAYSLPAPLWFQWFSLAALLALSLQVAIAKPAAAQVAVGDTFDVTSGVSGQKVDNTRPKVAGPARPPSIQDVLLEVCQSRSYGDDCAKILLGMAWKESQFESRAVGDDGRAHGFFQIHYKLHKIPLTCARDLRCSADWTISYLESNGYPKSVLRAVQCHNGCGAKNGYAASVMRWSQRLWQTSTEIKPIALK